MSDRDQDAEILALRRQITVLERQLGAARPRLLPCDGPFLAPLLHRLPSDVLGRFRLLVRPAGTEISWHAATRQVPAQAPGPATHRPLHPPADAAPGMVEPLPGYRRIHRELLVLGIKVAASTVWETCSRPGSTRRPSPPPLNGPASPPSSWGPGRTAVNVLPWLALRDDDGHVTVTHVLWVWSALTLLADIMIVAWLWPRGPAAADAATVSAVTLRGKPLSGHAQMWMVIVLFLSNVTMICSALGLVLWAIVAVV